MGPGPHAVIAERLLRFGLMTEPQIREFFNGDAVPDDPQRVADELVRRGFITAHQGVHLLNDELHLLELGGYRLLEPIGSGGMGEVFLAKQLKLNRLVAIKLIRPSFSADANLVARFRREALAVASMTHPNIVILYDADEINGIHFLAMEYVRGMDLAGLVAQHGPLPVAAACEYIRQSALGLQHAHEHRLIHRDIKPSNLLVSMSEGQGPLSPNEDFGLVKVLDLGLARLSEDPGVSHLTKDRGLLGTPDYMSPEQGRDSSKVDIRSDLYSLGCTFYFLLTGQAPFPDGTGVEKILCHQLERPKPITQFRQDVPPEVLAIINRLMRKEPRERFQTPLELVSELARVPSPHNAAPAAPPAALPPLTGITGRTPEPFVAPVSPPNTPTIRIPCAPQAPSVWGMFEQTSFGTSEHGDTPLGMPSRNGTPPLPASRLSTPPAPASPPSRLGLPPLPTSRTASATPTDRGSPRDPSRPVVVRGSPPPVQQTRGSSFCVPAQPIALLEGHIAPVTAMAFGPRGRILATGGLDQSIRIWRINADKTMQITEFHDPRLGEIRAMGFTGTNDLLIASSGLGGRVWFWSWQDERAQEMNALENSFGASVLAVSADGKQVAAGDSDRIAVWTEHNGVLRSRGILNSRGGSEITALAHNADGRLLLAGDATGHVQTWREKWRGHRPVAAFPAHHGRITDLRVSPDESRLATAGADGAVRLWTTRVEIKAVAQVVGALRGTVRRVQFGAVGSDFLTATDAGQVARWRSEDAGPIIEWRVNQPVSTCMAVADHGEVIALGRTDNAVQIYLLPPEPLAPNSLRASAQGVNRLPL